MHTPSAYTLTNTTRPSRIKGKIRGYARANALAAAVELVFSPRKQIYSVTTVTETNANKTPPQDVRVPRVATRGRVPMIHKLKRSCPVHERATPRAQTVLNTRARVHACVRARVFTRIIYNTSTQFYTSYTLEAHLSTLNYTRYGYVKPIVFVNCLKKNF